MRKMKLASLLLILIIPAIIWTQAPDNYDQLTLQQKALMKKAYNYGKEFDLGHSMAAIMWKESFVGDDVVPFNLGDPSGGYWHKHIDYLLIQEGKPVNNMNRNLAMLELIQNMDYAAALAIADLEHWQAEFGQNAWSKVYAAYNGGYSNSAASLEYAESVKAKVKELINKKVFTESD